MMENVNSSELGLLARVQPAVAAQRIYDAHVRHRERIAAADELGVTYQTLRKWHKRLARENVVAPEVAAGQALTLDEALEALEAQRRDPDAFKAGQEPLPTEEEARTLLQEKMNDFRLIRYDKANIPGPRNLDELGKLVGLDKYRLSRFISTNPRRHLKLPPSKLRSLVYLLKDMRRSHERQDRSGSVEKSGRGVERLDETCGPGSAE